MHFVDSPRSIALSTRNLPGDAGLFQGVDGTAGDVGVDRKLRRNYVRIGHRHQRKPIDVRMDFLTDQSIQGRAAIPAAICGSSLSRSE